MEGRRKEAAAGLAEKGSTLLAAVLRTETLVLMSFRKRETMFNIHIIHEMDIQ